MNAFLVTLVSRISLFKIAIILLVAQAFSAHAQIPGAIGFITPADSSQVNSASAVSISWGAPAGASWYNIRAVNWSNAADRIQTGVNNCPGDPHYMCINGFTSTSFSLPVAPGNWYGFWLHACNADGCGPVSYSNFYVRPAPPPPPAVPTIIGNLDRVDTQVASGWACIQGNPDTQLYAQILVTDQFGSTLGYTSQFARMQRIDVGLSGLCGAAGNANSHYHGFEFPLFMPGADLVRNKLLTVGIYLSDTTGLQKSFVSQVSFPESGLPTSFVFRTDYNDFEKKIPALASCPWPSLGANLRPGDNVPFTRPIIAGGSGVNPSQENLGFVSPNPLCITYPTDQSALASLAGWSNSNAYAGGPNGQVIWSKKGDPWPTSNYWVVHANVEPAFRMRNVPGANSGPPSQSEPINGGLFQVSSTSNALKLKIDNSASTKQNLPFVSVGAQMGRGRGAIAYLPPAAETFLEFDLVKDANSAPNTYSAVNVFLEVTVKGAKHWVWLALQQPISGYYQWNWNVLDSFFYPGAELNIFTASEINAFCGAVFPGAYTSIPSLVGVPIGQATQYKIPLRALFSCVESLRGDRTWEVNDSSSTLMLSGVHFGIETDNQQDAANRNNNVLAISIVNPRLTKP